MLCADFYGSYESQLVDYESYGSWFNSKSLLVIANMLSFTSPLCQVPCWVYFFIDYNP